MAKKGDRIEGDTARQGWGLLEFTGRAIQLVHGPKGNMWPSPENAAGSDWESFAHNSCHVAERSILYTIARQAMGN